MARNLVIGDIHAMYDRLVSVLSAAGFDPQEDTLYAVGDFCDRGPEPIRVLDYLMGLPHFLPVVGNHDMWLYEFLCGDGPAPIWLDSRNGGRVTFEAFRDVTFSKKERIREWYGSFPLLRIAGNNVMLHAGPPRETADMDSLVALTEGITLSAAYEAKPAGARYEPLVHDIVWDREYIRTAYEYESDPSAFVPSEQARRPFVTDRTIICGHTPLKSVFHSDLYHITCIDTGSFVPDGHITVMDIDTGELFVS
ncbi:MAG: fructose-bisphosphatase class III [Spirochaetales bacterium]|nr:fructose-bisphosphatase class III [Spirochaetales bacterium]